MTDNGTPEENDTLLVLLSIPRQSDEQGDADDITDVLVAMLNEERQRNADEAGRPDYYRPIRVMALPVGPQWLDVTDQKMLSHALRIVNEAKVAAEGWSS